MMFPRLGRTCAILAILLISACLMTATNARTVGLSDKEIAKRVEEKNNKTIINEFIRQELRSANEYAAKPLMDRYPSLKFFTNQAKRNPLESLLFLEDQVHKLIDAQNNINSLPYSVAFSSSEKKKILGLKDTAHRIVSYGIPLMKRDFYTVLMAARKLADEQRKHPMELLPKRSFRNAVYRECAPTAAELDREMGKLSEGELISMRLGWVLEQVTITRLWLVFNDNRLPEEDAYMAYRKKRSEYWQRRLREIYADK